MRTKLLVAICFLLMGHVSAQSYSTVTKTSADGKYTWREIENDPSHVRFYELKNGLTVILAENHLEPRIMSLFAVKAGSKNDPANNTGLAHYLEHMLFKGTDKFGSLDYEKESKQLAVVEALYEKYNKTRDPLLRKNLSPDRFCFRCCSNFCYC